MPAAPKLGPQAGKPGAYRRVFADPHLIVNTGMANRLERLQLAALRLREIQSEAAAIYRQFPELDRRPKRTRVLRAKAPGRPSIESVCVTKVH